MSYKRAAKKIGASVLIMLFWLLSFFFRFQTIAEILSIVPGSAGKFARFCFYSEYLQSVGKKVIFSFGSIITDTRTIIGDRVRIGPNNTIGYCVIGDDALFAQSVHILSGSNQHGYLRTDIPINQQTGTISKVEIGKDCWLGANTVVLASVGAGCVVGSGSVVVREVRDYSVVAGNPARVLKSRVSGAADS